MIMKGILRYYNTSSHLLFLRFFSTNQDNLALQLSDDIQYVYESLISQNLFPNISRYRLACIQQKIQNGHYRLSPLTVHLDDLDFMIPFMNEKLSYYPDLHLILDESKERFDKDIFIAVMPTDEYDVLVNMGLSVTLLRLCYGSLASDGFRINDRLSIHLKDLEEMDNVDKLYKFDLTSSIKSLPKTLVLNAVKSLIDDDGYVFKLICSALYISIDNADQS